MPEPAQTDLARAVQEVSERASLLIREEIELAKAEVSTKVVKLAKGAAVGAAAGVFLLAALVYLLHGAAWLLYKAISNDGSSVWIGYAIVTGALVLLAAIAGFVAFRFVKGGAPPTPQMAIEEAQLIRRTVSDAQNAPIERTT